MKEKYFSLGNETIVAKYNQLKKSNEIDYEDSNIELSYLNNKKEKLVGIPAAILLYLFVHNNNIPVKISDKFPTITKPGNYYNKIRDFLSENSGYFITIQNKGIYFDSKIINDITDYDSKSSNLSGRKILESHCRFLPASSFLGEEYKATISELLVPPRLHEIASNKEVYIDDILTGTSPVRLAILGEASSGRSTLLRALILRLLKKDDAKFLCNLDNSSFDYIFYMDLREIANDELFKSNITDFDTYIELSMRVWETTLSEKNVKKVIYNIKNKYLNPIFIIYGLEYLPENENLSCRKRFCDSLKEFTEKTSNISVIISSTEKAYIDVLSDSDFNLYKIIPFNNKEKREFCENWIRFSHSISKSTTPVLPSKLENEANALYNAVTNIKSFQTDNPLMLTYYVVMLYKYRDVLNSQSDLHLMESLSYMAMRHLFSLTSSKSPSIIDEREFKIPFSYLALKFAENDLDSMYIHTVFGIEDSVEEILKSDELGETIEDYKTDNLHLGENSLSQIEGFLECLVKFPFIKLDNAHTKIYFSSSMLMAYYASYAIAHDFYKESSLKEYLEKQIRKHCNKEYSSIWISIIAGAAIISGRNAYKYVDILRDIAKDSSPFNRRARELSVCAIAAILVQRPYLSPENRKKALKGAYCYYCFNDQLEYTNQLLSNPLFRKSTITEFYQKYNHSFGCDDPFPIYIWILGYIHWFYPSIRVTDSPDSIIETMKENNFFNGYTPEPNKQLGILLDEIEKLKNSQKPDDVSQLLIDITGCCNFFWLTSESVDEINYKSSNVNSVSLLDGISGITERCLDVLCDVIHLNDWRIKNMAFYAITHIISIEKREPGEHKGRISQKLYNMFKDNDFLTQIVYADYVARKRYDKKNSPDQSVLCGALRVLTVMPMSCFKYSKDKFKENDMNRIIAKYYREKWDALVIGSKSTDKSEAANSSRYLMLMFKLMLFTGVFEQDDLTERSENNPIFYLLRLKDENFDIQNIKFSPDKKKIGLGYDKEDMFFDELLEFVKEKIQK